MSWTNKVVWSEGMFLRTQHFQQHDRYVERLVRARCADSRAYNWGVKELKIESELLKVGKIGLAACRGILEDGTPFNLPNDSDPPAPLDLKESVKNTTVYLALPLARDGVSEVDVGIRPDGVARYIASDYEVRDSNDGADTSAQIQVGKLRFRLLLESEERGGYSCIGVARIIDVGSDGNVILDDEFIPPCLDCNANPRIAAFLNELQGLLHHRGEALAGRVSESGRGGAAEIADFLLLQAVNRYEPLLAHLTRLSDLHPEALYQLGLQIAGELATFTEAGKRPGAFAPYRHDALKEVFASVMGALRQSLSIVLEQTAIPIPLQKRRYGVQVAPISDRGLLKDANFVLAVSASVPGETVRTSFPAQVKIGPVEKIRELVNVSLPGIGLRPLPVAPRQIPYHAGVTYFELDRANDLWKQLGKSGGIAFHASGDFPDLELALWAIKG